MWQVIPLALVLATPFAVGAAHGAAAVRRGDPAGWIGLILHLAMTIVAIVVPISEGLTN